MFRALLPLLSLTLAAVTLADERPNIVIIMADDLGWNGLGCYGSKLAQTPCLDQLAAEGMRFTDAYAMSQCLPTRAAVFSGQYGARTGLTSVETSSPGYAPMISPGRPKALEPEVYTLFEMKYTAYASFSRVYMLFQCIDFYQWEINTFLYHLRIQLL